MAIEHEDRFRLLQEARSDERGAVSGVIDSPRLRGRDRRLRRWTSRADEARRLHTQVWPPARQETCRERAAAYVAEAHEEHEFGPQDAQPVDRALKARFVEARVALVAHPDEKLPEHASRRVQALEVV